MNEKYLINFLILYYYSFKKIEHLFIFFSIFNQLIQCYLPSGIGIKG